MRPDRTPPPGRKYATTGHICPVCRQSTLTRVGTASSLTGIVYTREHCTQCTYTKNIKPIQ